MVVIEKVQIRNENKKRVLDVEVILMGDMFDIGELIIKEKEKRTVYISWKEIIRQTTEYIQRKYNNNIEFIWKKYPMEEKSKIA
ncbi:hypothetical protein NE634_15565 [Lacrimispora saccharolytica]|nr:hypothetical protein [Lacrimispora saccharolytica]